MTSLELLYEFHLLLNKNATYQDVDVSPGNFVTLFNRELLRWLDEYIVSGSTTDKIHDIQGVLSVSKPLTLLNKTDEFYTFELPENYFRFVDCKSHIEKDGCKVNIINYLQKPKDIENTIYNFPPSFEFEEGLCNIAEEKVFVYTSDFKINSTSLSYYHKPSKIDIEGYEKIDGSYSTNIDSDLDESLQREILDRVVLEVMRQFENGNGWKLSQDRIK